MARIHGTAGEVILLATSGKLTKTARNRFDMNIGTVNETWPRFKQAIARKFKRNIPYHVTMQKAANRKWLSSKKSFHECTMHELKLLQNLNFPKKEAIHFLINGITNSALHGMATLLNADSTNKFLKQMHGLIIAYGDANKRSPPPTKKFDKDKPKDSAFINGKSADFSRDSFCIYCHKDT